MTPPTATAIPETDSPERQQGNGTYGSDLMVDLLEATGAEYVFINPGSSFRGIHDSLVNYHGNRAPEIVLATHEMSAVAMAHGYFKATRKIPVAILHNLVGLMNGSMAVFNAYCDQIPLVLLGGSGPADPADRRFIDWAHSANTQGDLVRAYVKWTDEPATLAGTLDSMARAWRKAAAAPAGPVYVSIDAGQQEALAGGATAPDPTLPRYLPPAPVWPHPDAVAAAADALVASRMPLVIGGRFGIEDGISDMLVRLTEMLGAAYMDDRCVAGFPSEHPQNLNGDRKIRAEADVLLCLDVQDLTLATGGYGGHRSGIMGVGAGAEGATIIDVSMNDYFGNSWTRFGGPTAPLDLQVLADPRLALQALTEAVAARIGTIPPVTVAERRAALASRKAALTARRGEVLRARWSERPISLQRVTHEVYQAVKAHDWSLVVRNHRTWAEGYWPVARSGQYLGGDGGGGVGYGPGAAVGAALGLKGTGKLPVAMIGDGDFMMAPGAIWTGLHHGAPLLMVILNNRSWGNDELHQREIATHRGRSAATAHIGQTTRQPDADLASVARGFGAQAFGPIDDPEALAATLTKAVAVVQDGGIAVVEVITALE